MNLKDRLSHLNYQEARKLLGPGGDRLIRQGGRYEIDIAAQVELDANRFLVRLNGSEVTIRLDPSRNRKLRYRCSSEDRDIIRIGGIPAIVVRVIRRKAGR